MKHIITAKVIYIFEIESDGNISRREIKEKAENQWEMLSNQNMEDLHYHDTEIEVETIF